MGKLANHARHWFGLLAAILVVIRGVATDSRAATWSEISTGLPSASVDVSALVIAPTTPSTIYALTRSADYTGGIFKTTDGAGSWRAMSNVVGVNSLVVDPTNPSTIYALTGRGILKSTNGGENWIGVGPGLPDIYSYVTTLAIDPITPTTLYAAVSDVTGSVSIFKSTNGGGSWNVLDTGRPSNFILSLVIDPTAPSTIYAVFLFDVLKSTDGGESWIGIGAGLGLPGSQIRTLAIDPITTATLYAVTGGPFASIFKSTNGGASWNTLNTGLPPNTSMSYTFFGSLAIDPTTSATIYAGGSVSPLRGPASGFLIKSKDGGASWNAIDLGLSANTAFGSVGDPVGSLAIDPVASSTIYVIAYRRIVKSTDGGASWRGAGNGLTTIDVHALAVNRVDAATVYAGAGDSLFQSVDSGASWSKLFAFQLPSSFFVPDPAPGYPHSLLIDFVNPNILYAGTFRGGGCTTDDKLLFKSTDGGLSWSDSISPDKSGCAGAGDIFLGIDSGPDLKAIDPTDPNTLYVTASGEKWSVPWLLRSKEGGASWTTLGPNQSPDNLTVRGWDTGVKALAIDPANPATLYAGLWDGLSKSTDDGASWNRIGLSGAIVNLLAIDPAHTGVLYAVGAEGSDGVPQGFRGLFKSTDSGASWTPIGNGLASLLDTGSNMTALVFDPADSNILYAGTAGGGVFKSSDGGANWSGFNDGLANLDVRVLAVAPGSRHTLYAGTAGGLFRIIDDAP